MFQPLEYWTCRVFGSPLLIFFKTKSTAFILYTLAQRKSRLVFTQMASWNGLKRDSLESVLPCLHLHQRQWVLKNFFGLTLQININMVLHILGNRKDMREITVYLEQIVKILTFWIILAVFSLQSMECQIGNLHILSQTNRTYQKQLKKAILFISKCYKNSKLFRNANSTNRKHFSWNYTY